MWAKASAAAPLYSPLMIVDLSPCLKQYGTDNHRWGDTFINWDGDGAGDGWPFGRDGDGVVGGGGGHPE